jgi:hypothetical protein
MNIPLPPDNQITLAGVAQFAWSNRAEVSLKHQFDRAQLRVPFPGRAPL